MSERVGAARKEIAPTLSAHLTREAQRFLLYPNRISRTRINLEAQAILDRIRRQLIDWRKTFTPPSRRTRGRVGTTEWLGEVYCRDLLKAIPEIVERTRRLSNISFGGIAADDEAVAYLREAANCYIFGLTQAAIALARAAVEVRFRSKAVTLLGAQAVENADLKTLLNDQRTARLLSREGRNRAQTIRQAANRVLHEELAEAGDALSVIESAREVLLELSKP
jgi:hypothetical protein